MNSIENIKTVGRESCRSFSRYSDGEYTFTEENFDQFIVLIAYKFSMNFQNNIRIPWGSNPLKEYVGDADNLIELKNKPMPTERVSLFY